MSWRNKIDKPWERQLVLIVNDNDFEALEHTAEGRDILRDPHLEVVKIDDKEFFKQFRKMGTGVLASGTLLIQNSLDPSTYYDVIEARANASLERFASSVELFENLGAKSVEIIEVRIKDKEKGTFAGLTASFKAVEGGMKGHDIEIKNFYNRLNISLKFKKSNFDLIGAKRLLIEKGLDSDPMLKSLVNMSEKKKNPTEDFTRELFLSESVESTFELAANLKIPIGGLGAKIKEVVKERLAYSVVVKVSFKE